MPLTVSTEESPLLKPNRDEGESSPPIHVLGELVGARHLNCFSKDDRRVELYCIVQFGPKILHRTKPLMKSAKLISPSLQDPIWSIKDSPLFITSITPNDIGNHKILSVTLWARRRPKSTSIRSKAQVEFCGKVRLKVAKVLESCTEERIEFELVDELGRSMQGDHENSPKLALRFRVASEADLNFVTAWNHATDSKETMIPRTILNGTGVVPQEHRKRANLVTELDEGSVPGAKLSSAISSSVTSLPRTTMTNRVRVKPFPDSEKSASTTFMTPSKIKETAILPSREWVDSGSGTLGRLYLEVLSCHNLPNVDIGNAIGNKTDTFVAAVYGDAMVQTCVIDDELNPLWMPWTQRAFVLNMLHPSQVLYLAVCGYKRGLLSHVPIGRVEIDPVNLQRDTVYDLQYSLFRSSHTNDTKGRGTIRIRLRLEIYDERAALLAALKPYPELYVNARKIKSLRVARYACCGEYDNEERFSLQVLLAFADELKDKYLRRIIYGINDGCQSLFYWRGQVKVGPWWLPLHSLLLFCTGIILIERPQLIPSVISFGIAWMMLVNMRIRKQSPSPWYRCFSFWHYFRILLLGSSSLDFKNINPGESCEKQKAIEDALKSRMEEDDKFMEMKEAAEKKIEEVENVSVDTKSNATFIPIDVLVVLGKLQGIVGNICRLCRSMNSIITWEASDLSFWITASFLAIGILFVFIPWGFLIKWTGRVVIVLLLGPQNKLIELFREEKSKDEKMLRKLLAERWDRARIGQEEAGKLKAFRSVLFGRYSTAVPTSMWTPHQDRPLPQSQAHVVDAITTTMVKDVEHLPYVPGQKLYGNMISRPHDDWTESKDQSTQGNQYAKVALRDIKQSESMPMSPVAKIPQKESVEDEGIEITDEFDEEANFVENAARPQLTPPNKVREERMRGDWGVEVEEDVSIDKAAGETPLVMPSTIWEDSLRGDWGIEIAETFDEEARFSQQNWQGSIHDFPEVDDSTDSEQETLYDDHATSAQRQTRMSARGVSESEVGEVSGNSLGAEPPATQLRADESTTELGVEVVDFFEDEATFIQNS
jgi:hypothetical protein